MAGWSVKCFEPGSKDWPPVMIEISEAAVLLNGYGVRLAYGKSSPCGKQTITN